MAGGRCTVIIYSTDTAMHKKALCSMPSLDAAEVIRNPAALEAAARRWFCLSKRPNPVDCSHSSSGSMMEWRANWLSFKSWLAV